MTRTKAARRPSAPKAKSAPKTAGEYIARFPQPARAALKKMRGAIRAAVPREATETISYRIPAFRHEKVLVWYAAFSDHCSLFPTAAVLEEFRHELKNYSTSKGTIHFPFTRPLPIALIRKIVKARVAQLAGKPSR